MKVGELEGQVKAAHRNQEELMARLQAESDEVSRSGTVLLLVLLDWAHVRPLHMRPLTRLSLWQHGCGGWIAISVSRQAQTRTRGPSGIGAGKH